MQSLQQRNIFRLEYDSLVNDQEREAWFDARDREWENYNHRRRTAFRANDDDDNALQAKGSRTQIRSWELCKINKGDHIGWHRPCRLYWHHAIVADIDEENRRLLVIHFKKENKVFKIIKEWIDVKKQTGDMFIFQYSSEIQGKNSTSRVLDRAHNLVYREYYDLVKNNCEHFATYCKTGQKESVQEQWISDEKKEIINTIVANTTKSAVRLGCNIGSEVAKKSGSIIATGCGKVVVSEGIEWIGNASNWVGAGIVIWLGTFHCLYDLNRLRINKGISERDLKVTATLQISKGVFGIAGAVAGSFIPVIGTAVGTFFGSVIGGAIGSLAGKTIGILVGGLLGRCF